MTVSVIVPFQPDEGGDRERNWAWLRRRYEVAHSDWELIEAADPVEGIWSKGRAVNAGVRAATGDVLVIADADVLVGNDTLVHSARMALHEPWVVPHGQVFRLNEPRTLAVLENDPASVVPASVERTPLVRRPYIGPAGGGISVMRREAFETVGGIDERFLAWGGEDISFGWALDTLVGPAFRVGAPLWHLWHTPQERPRPTHPNNRLAGVYKDATGSPRLMRAVIDGQDPGTVDELATPARFAVPGKAWLRILGRKIIAPHGVIETIDPDVAEALRRHPAATEVTA